MSNRRRESRPKGYVREPVRCSCQPGPDAHPEHSKPGRTAADHTDPNCPHWDRSSVAIGISSRILSDPARVKRLTRGLLGAIERLQLEPTPNVAPST